MKFRPLGHTDLQVSLLGLGTMTFGQQNSEAEAHVQLDRAVAAGVNLIDTAEMYPVPPQAETQGRTEAYIGSWLQSRGGRERIVLASKVTGRAPAMPWLRGGPVLDRNSILAAFDDSLRRLRTDYIDLYQIHWPDRSTNFFGQLGYQVPTEEQPVPIAETLEALDRLVRQGKVRHIGVSNETPWGIAEYLKLAEHHNLPRISSVQNPYNLLNRSFEIGLAEFAHREQVGLLAYSPLAFGVLSGKYLHGQRPAGARMSLFERFSRYTGPIAEIATAKYVAVAGKFGLDPAQMALAYINSRPFVTSNLIGATTLEQLDRNLAAVDLELSAEILAEIENVHHEHPNPAP